MKEKGMDTHFFIQVHAYHYSGLFPLFVFLTQPLELCELAIIEGDSELNLILLFSVINT